MKKKAMIAMTTLGLALSSVTINAPFTQQVVYADAVEEEEFDENVLYLELEGVLNSVNEYERAQYLARFIELYLKQEGLKLQEKVIKNNEKAMVQQRLRYDLGLMSLQDFLKGNKDTSRQIKDFKKDQDQLKLDIEKLFRELNFYDREEERELVLKRISDEEIGEITKVERPSENELNSIVGSSRMLDYTLRETVMNQFLQLYFDLNQAYESFKRAEQDLEFAREDYHQVRVSHKLGLVSKFDLEQAELTIEQANFSLMQAKLTYYLLQQQIEEL